MNNCGRTFGLAAFGVMLAAGDIAAQNIPGALIPSERNPPTRQGTRGANFLEIGVGARGNAMAGAIASLVEGPTAWYWNPGGAVNIEGFGIAASRQNMYEGLDITHNFVGLALPLAGGVFGINFIALNSGDIPRTTEFSPLGDDPVLGNTFEWNSTAIGAGYARRLTDRLSVGGQLKFVQEGITDAKTGWASLDLGTQFQTGIYGLVLGAQIANVGPSAQARGSLTRRRFNTDEISPARTAIEFQTQETELPTMFRFSVGADVVGRSGSIFGQGGGIHSLLSEVAFSDAIDSDIQAALGLEYGFRNLLFLRGGKRWYGDQRDAGEDSKALYGLSGGFGVRLPISGRGLRFDYGYVHLGDQLENVQVFSLEFGR